MASLARFLPEALQAVFQTGPKQIDPSVFPAHCAQFSSIVDIPQAKVHFAEYLPNGTVLALSENHPSCEKSEQIVLADLCRISFTVPTSETSEITLETWLPQDYTGRFLSVGNRGLGGCIQYSELAMASSLGFGSVGANNGHNGTGGEAFFNNHQTIEDYAYRSVQTGATIGKRVVDQFYKFAHRKSYFIGCSSGGRQGFKLAQDFPGDFDGIIAGAPAISFTGILSWSASFYNKTGPPGSETFLDANDWALVHDETLRQCDGLDGALDGLLENPELCHFVPETLICLKGQKKGCLTGKQVETVRAIFEPIYGTNGKLVYPRMQYGINTKDYVPFYFNGEPWDLTRDWGRYVVYNDTEWDGSDFDISGVDAFHSHNPYNVETWKGDLSSFANTGGKLISYHGLHDFVISSEISSLYYSHVASTMNRNPSELDEFYRLFFVSGLEHCRGGPGYSALGQDLGAMGDSKAGSNLLSDLVKWVEEGVAPEVLQGAKLDKEGKAEAWRPHCKWPRRSRFINFANGEGGQWTCLEPYDASARDGAPDEL